MADFAHITVLADEVVELLAPRPGGVYVDGTLGGAGHAVRILEASGPDSRVIGIDRDPTAIAAATARLAPYGARATAVHGRYGDMRAILSGMGVERVDGIVLDLGFSSVQIDTAERGFSFMKEGPLDMRMDPSQGETAAELLHRSTPEQIANLIWRYGEEPYSRKIARAIKAAPRMATTHDLSEAVASALPARELAHRKTDPATRTFQALRIAVNDEIGELERFLADFPSLLKVGGRVAVIAFHSLEDRLVKDRLRDLSRHPGVPKDVAEKMGIRPEPELELITRKPVFPSDDEVARNPRARSARLRVGERR